MSSISLESLDEFLLVDILEHVEASSPQTIDSVNLVSRCMHTAARWIKYRRLEIWFNDESTDAQDRTPFIQSWLENEDVQRNIRVLTIRGDRCLNPAESSNVAALIEKAANIKQLDWDIRSNLPMCVLSALHQHHPRAKLWLSKFIREEGWLNHMDEVEIALACSPALRSIESLCWSTLASDRDFRLEVFSRIVANAPNIEHAEITRSPGMAENLVPMSITIMMKDKTRFDDSFGAEQTPSSKLKSLVLKGWSPNMDTVAEWSGSLNFSNLEGFHCTGATNYDCDVEFYQWAQQMLPNLHDLTLNINWRCPMYMVRLERLINFLENCPPLRSLRLLGADSQLPLGQLLKRHANTLKKLELHAMDGTNCSPTILNAATVRKIGILCPRLTDLTINLPQGPRQLYIELNRTLLGAIVSLKLDQLQVYMDFGLRKSKGSREEDLTQVIKNIWKIVFGRAPTWRKRVLNVNIGEWEPQQSPRDMRERSLWEARPHVRDDMYGSAVFKKEALPEPDH